MPPAQQAPLPIRIPTRRNNFCRSQGLPRQSNQFRRSKAFFPQRPQALGAIAL